MKLFAAFVAALVFYSETTAQGTYLSGGFGYGFPAGDRVGVTVPNYTDENVYGSFGEGLTIGLNVNYFVNDNVGLDLGFWYVIGSTYKFITNPGYNVHLVSGKTFRIMPGIKITGGKTKRPYAKFGPVLGIATVLSDEETRTTTGGTTYPNHEFTGGSANGWRGALGMDFFEDKATTIFLEINFCYQVFKPDLETITTPGQPTEKYTLLDEPNPAAPYVKLRPSFPFSTIGIVAGVKFSSGSKSKDASRTPAKK